MIALLLGALQGLAFAPRPLPAWCLPLLQCLALGGLGLLVYRAGTLKRAVWLGAAFGAGNFAVGISWIYISLHDYAFMAAPLAALGVALLAAYLALYPALATGLAWRLGRAQPRLAPLALAASWTAAEWLRGVLLTGFPWLNIGYAHVDGPLHGWAPVLGVYGVTFAAALAAGSLAQAANAWFGRAGGVPWRMSLAVALAVAAAGTALSFIPWTHPEGPPLAVRLVQANVPLDEKFDPAKIWQGMERHRQLAAQPRADGQATALTLMPETAVPVFQDQLTPEAWQEWIDSAAASKGTFALGAALREHHDDRDYYYNSVITLDASADPQHLIAARPAQRYDKRHLVPFGEFVPQGFHWFVEEMVMPLGDFDRGAGRQPPFAVGGQRIAMNICYEDIFGEELLPALRAAAGSDGATILANVGNLAWFGDSLALPQQLQMSRMRTRETGRPMLRATNTGMTAVIDAQGRIADRLAPHTAGVLDATVQGTAGLTPYARAGNAPILALVIAILAFLAWRQRHRAS